MLNSSVHLTASDKPNSIEPIRIPVTHTSKLSSIRIIKSINVEGSPHSSPIISSPQPRASGKSKRRVNIVGNSLGKFTSGLIGGNDEVELKATVLLQRKNVFDLNDELAVAVDGIAEIAGENVKFQLVSVETDEETGSGKRSGKAPLEGWLTKATSLTADEGEIYTVRFKVGGDFGVPGAVLVENHHPNGFFLKNITLDMPSNKPPLHFQCNSWVDNHKHYDGPRIFFTNQG